jgi:hydrogenase maturation protease
MAAEFASSASQDAADRRKPARVRPSVLVAGVGNIFLGDDAFGVEVVERLAQCALPEHVRVADFGIRGYDLAYTLMEPWELVILADAVPRGGEPGTVYLIEAGLPPEEEASAEFALDAHSMDPVAVLQLVRRLGGEARRVLVVGCEPATVVCDESGQLGLSDPVRAAVDEAVAVIQELIARKQNIIAA